MEDKQEQHDGFIDLEEGDRIEKYIQITYSPRVPPPNIPNLTFWNLVGMTASFFSISAIGAVVFSSIRTGGYFYIVEDLLLSRFNIPTNVKFILSVAAFVSALFAFEGYALADGFSKGEKIDNVSSSRTGLIFSFIVISVVGIFSGLSIADIPDSVNATMEIISALVTSVAAAFIAFFGGKNIGFAFGQFKKKKQEELDAHQERYDKWREGAVRSYRSQWGKFKKSSNLNTELNANEQGFRDEQELNAIENKNSKMFQALSKPEQVEQLVGQYVQKYSTVPTVRQMAEQGYSVGSASNGINLYIANNAESLLNSGILAEKRISKAIENVSRN